MTVTHRFLFIFIFLFFLRVSSFSPQVKFWSRRYINHSRQISKHLQVCQKYSTLHCNFNSALSVWKCTQTWFFVFDILHSYLNDRLNLWYSLCNPESCSHSIVKLRPHFHVCWSFHMFQTNCSVPNRTRLTCVVKDTNYNNSQIEWCECSSLSDSQFAMKQIAKLRLRKNFTILQVLASVWSYFYF